VTYFTSIRLWSTDKRVRFAIALLLTVAFTAAVKGQVLQTDRYEVPVLNFEKNFEIIPAGRQGLYLHRRLNAAKEDQLQLIKLDTAFKEKWSGFLAIEKNYMLMGKKSFGSKLFLLLRYRDYTKNDLILFVISEENGSYLRYVIKSFIPFAPGEFRLTEKAALIGGYYNHVPVVLHFLFSTMKSKVLPGLFNESGELTQIRTHPDASFDVLISARNFQKQRTIWIKNYDPEGNIIRNFSLDAEDNKHLIFGRSLKTDKNMQLVAGVYGSRSAEFSRGLFITSIDPSGIQQMRYYNFADLKNFFKYMKANREKRIKSRIERKKIKGKKIRFNYRFLVHELIPYNNQYILLGEAFYPRYTTVDRSAYSSFFNPFINPNAIVQNGRIFDGYYYTHAVVMCFDTSGNLIWDNSFEINDVRTFTLEQFVKLEVHPDKIALLYLFENEIRTKIIKGGQVLEGKTIDPIKTMFENDIVKKEVSDHSKLEYWYGDYLYAYGVQEIVNATVNGLGKRRVFYINKVTYSEGGK
jgi:hypothetical protein